MSPVSLTLIAANHHPAGKFVFSHYRYSEVPATIPVENLSAAMGLVSLNSPVWVKNRRAQCEQNRSALLLKADMRADMHRLRLGAISDSCTAPNHALSITSWAEASLSEI
jgi:hypothetical protein